MMIPLYLNPALLSPLLVTGKVFPLPIRYGYSTVMVMMALLGATATGPVFRDTV